MMILTTSESKAQSSKHKAHKKDESSAPEIENKEIPSVESASLSGDDKNEPDINIKDTNIKDAEENSTQSALEKIQDELGAEREKYLRLAAEYDNFRKRSAKEREMTYSSARIDTITKLLPVYDNLERALKMECADEAYYKGVEMIMLQLTEVFEDIGVRQIPAVGEPFDPNRHSAVLTIEDPELGENIVAEEYQKGFILGERVIRFSTVVVAN